MIAAPILTAEEILVSSISTALAAYAERVYYQLAIEGARLPYIIFHGQSDINRLDWVGDTAAQALVTVKAVAGGSSVEGPIQARALLLEASAGMDELTYSGYTIKARYVNTPIIPPTPAGGGIQRTYQSAHVFRVTIERN